MSHSKILHNILNTKRWLYSSFTKENKFIALLPKPLSTLPQCPLPIPKGQTRESRAHCIEKNTSFWTKSLHSLQDDPPSDLFLERGVDRGWGKGRKRFYSPLFYFKVCFSWKNIFVSLLFLRKNLEKKKITFYVRNIHILYIPLTFYKCSKLFNTNGHQKM